MNTTRRDLFKFVGGSVVGALFTPAPWRLITDSALWSENWPGIPRPARGEIRTRFTNCALCPAGCAVRARCVGDQPVALTGVSGHPLSHGALCPFGLTAHQLPYLPTRLKQGPAKEAAEAVAAAIAKCGPSEQVAVLDLRPGRTASWTYRRALASVKNGLYLAPPSPLGGSAAFDLQEAKTVLSFGAPLLDGWGTPGNVIAARENFRLIQAEPLESRTASLADLWLPIRPGSEEALAQAIANVLANRRGQGPGGAPADSAGRGQGNLAALTGLTEQQIRSVAEELANNGPALVLDGGQVPAVMELNRLLGGLGRTIVARRETPVPESWKKVAPVTNLTSVPDGSIRVLLIDESSVDGYLSWGTIERKLVRDNPLIVTFAWSRQGYGRYAQYVLPTAVYPEVFDDIPPAIDSVAAAFRIAVPLVAPPAGMVNPSEFIGGLAGLPAADALRERADAIHKAGRGTLFTYAGAKSTALREVKPDDFWKALNEGGCWLDAVDESGAGHRFSWPANADDEKRSSAPPEDLPLVAITCETRAAAAPLSPLMSKLYQESNLLLSPNHAVLNPVTARACGVGEGARAILQTRCGSAQIEISLDSGVPPGVVKVAAGAGMIDLCGASTRAKVVAA
jgi:anaerobic selenocysteine-containing dehydrogenase